MTSPDVGSRRSSLIPVTSSMRFMSAKMLALCGAEADIGDSEVEVAPCEAL
jgi:hypothetical protein